MRPRNNDDSYFTCMWDAHAICAHNLLQQLHEVSKHGTQPFYVLVYDLIYESSD